MGRENELTLVGISLMSISVIINTMTDSIMNPSGIASIGLSVASILILIYVVVQADTDEEEKKQSESSETQSS